MRRGYSQPYDAPWWGQLRIDIFQRDRGVCRSRVAKRCLGDVRLTLMPNCPNTMVLGHVVDWRTNEGSWWDEDNLRLECKSCSASESRRRKMREGWKHSTTEVVLVVGPPGVGKREFVSVNSTGHDLIVDFDMICMGLGSPVEFDHEKWVIREAKDQRNALLRKVREGETGAGTAWVTSSAPDAEKNFVERHRVELLDPGIEVALERVADRPKRWASMVEKWYELRTVGSWVWG